MTDPNPADIADLFAPVPDDVIETHVSRVFLAGDRAWKLKKAVALPYVDFSTLEKRRIACEREVLLNRRTAPQLYLGCRAVYRDAMGKLSFDPQGTPVEWLVEMRRFDAHKTLDRLLADDAVTPAMIAALATDIAAFHARAERVDREATAMVAQTIALNDAAFANLPAGALPAEALAGFRAALGTEIERRRSVLLQRRADGRMRHGHGDLHLRNIAVIDGQPVLFDCLEFDDDLAAIDTLYDLAFLLMDLVQQRRGDLASLALNAWLEAMPDDAGMALLPLYVALRAAIRCHIAALTEAGRPEATRYLALARQALKPPSPRLILVGGLSGTGKSTLARALAPDFGGLCGAVILRSDTIRKNLHNVPVLQRLPKDSYTPDSSRRVYATLLERARVLLQGGASVILDAVYGKPEEREAAAALARDMGCRCDGLWLTAAPDILTARVAARRNDASDATEDVVHWQLQHLSPPADWKTVDAGAGPEETLRRAKALLA
ncbi:MAG: AAA family ATPase [Ferrovibrio sp.]